MLVIFLVSMFFFILMNIPIAFSLVLTSLVLMASLGTSSPAIVSQNIVRGVDNFPLMAIPFFVLAGEIMNVGGISKRIVNFAKTLIGHVTGGLGYVAVLASMLFAGVSGSAIADTTAIGSILLPVMDEQGYKKGKSTALIISAGTIGPVIPPSIPMILFGVVGGVSIVKLFLGGVVPGVLIGVALMIGWYFHSKKMGYQSTKRASLKEMIKHTIAAFWAILLPVIIMGGILGGIFTPTEAAVVAVVYALLVGFFAYKELKLHHLPEIFVQSAKSTSIVMLVCGAATAAGYFITTAQIPAMLSEALLAVSNNIYVLMLLINILLLLVGCVMDLTPALLILAPILLPIATRFGLDPIYFGVVMVCNLCIGTLTPPVGTVLYVGCGLSGLSMWELVKPTLGFIAIMVAVLLLITYVPGLILYLPYAIGN